MCESYFSSTLRDDTFKFACAIAAQKTWDCGSVDAKCAFLFAELPKDTKLIAQIPEGHPEDSLRQTQVLQILKKIYGQKKAQFCVLHKSAKCSLKFFHLKQSSYDF